MNRFPIQTVISKLLTPLLLVMTLLTAELGIISAPALADSQFHTALAMSQPLAAVSRQSMAATQNKAGNFAETKGQLDSNLTSTVTNVKTEIQDATEGAVKTAKRKVSTDTKKLEDAATKAQKQAKKDITKVQTSAEELGETIQENAEAATEDL